MNEVDYIGKKSVMEVIKLSKLSKFIVFQQGATKGSTPVYRCTDAKSVEKAQKAFEDWADSILRMNANNNRAYELFLFSHRSTEADIDDDIDENAEKDKGTKKDKIRFSFSLNPYNNMYGSIMGGGLNVQEEIQKGIEAYKNTERMNRLEAEIKLLREGGGEDEDEEEESAFDKVSNLIKLVRQGDLHKVAGDDDETMTKEKVRVPNVSDDMDADKIRNEKEVRNNRLKTAIHRIMKLDPEFRGLLKLSLLAEKSPAIFQSYMKTLMNMEL